MMRKPLLVAVAAATLSVGIALPLLMIAVPHPTAAQDRDDRREPHPVIKEAMGKIENAKNDLVNYADRDFKGHRAKAVVNLNQALEELKMALEADRH
jgi:hypothetical protein